ncbi:MAG: hypothetical protein CVV58_02785, partial [Tenericutes bacterium HGW-Tenericutes-3]
MKKVKQIFILIGMIFLLASCAQGETFTISFNSNGGSYVESITFDTNESFTTPLDPTKTGYDFAGWFLDDATFDVPVSAESLIENALSELITVYAKWTAHQYTITFDSNGGSSVSSMTLDHQASVTAPLSPTKTGYTFAGWYSDSALNTAYMFASMPAQDLTLYAKWILDTESPVTYTIVWQNADGSVLETDVVESGVVPSYDGLTPTKASTETHTYAFIGFTPTVGAATGNQTYTATYQETLIDTQIPFNPSDLNDIFGFNIYTLIPTFETYDYVIVDFSDATFFEVYVDMFDWTENDVDAFIDLLDAQLTYDDLEESWILGDYYIYAYEDVETYEGLT